MVVHRQLLCAKHKVLLSDVVLTLFTVGEATRLRILIFNCLGLNPQHYNPNELQLSFSVILVGLESQFILMKLFANFFFLFFFLVRLWNTPYSKQSGEALECEPLHNRHHQNPL